MNIAIRYFTKSKKGNTKKLADAISKALGVEALDVEHKLNEKVDVLFLVNAMYAADIDAEVKAFLEANASNIGELVNLNTSATGRSTLPVIKKVAQSNGINVSEKEFHCKGSWIFLNKGFPTDENLSDAQKFVKDIIK